MKSLSTPRFLLVLALGLAVVGSSALMAGCGSETTAVATDASAGVASSGPPTLAELTAAVDLTPSQSNEITPPLGRWHTRDGEMRRARQAGNFERGEGFRPPRESFLMESAPILEHDQFLAMISFLSERREQAREQCQAGARQGEGPRQGRGDCRGRMGQGGKGDGSCAPGSGPGMHQGRGGRGGPGSGLGQFLRELDLDEATRTQLREAVRAHREIMRGLHQQYRDGDLTDEAFRDQSKAERTSFEATLAGILGAENFARYEEFQARKRVEFAERRLERLGEGIERRVEFLTAVLELDGDQVAQVTAILENAIPAREALLTSLRDGGIEMEDFRYASKQLHDATREALEAVLTAEQIAILNALDSLRPGRGHRGGAC